MPHARDFTLAAIVLTASLRAQAPSERDGHLVLRSDTRVVEIDVSVRDAHGKPVEDLNRNDFSVTDNGKPRSFSIFGVSRFAPFGDAPHEACSAPPAPQLPPNTFTNTGQPAHPPSTHSTILLLDAVNGWFDNFALARAGVLGMLNKVPADEKIALYVLARHRGLAILQDYTLDRSLLMAAMGKYIPEWMCPASRGGESGDEGMRDGGPGRAASIRIKFEDCRDPRSMYSEVESTRQSFDALATSLRSQPGRKSVFWVTQGFPPSLLRQDRFWDETISRINDANMEVNAVDSNGILGPPPYWGPGGTLTMIELARRTGGTAYHDRNDLDGALTEGIADSRATYTLGFYLTEADGRYHQLKVRVNRPNLELNYRRGYYAVDEPKPDKSKKNMDLSAALLSPADSPEIGITASLNVKPDGPPGSVNVSLRLSPDALSLKAALKTAKAGKTGKVSELYVVWNAAGKVLERQSATSRFEVGPEKQAVFSRDGITVLQPLQLPADAAKLSIIVQDTESGRTGSLTVPLDKVAVGK